MSDDSWFDEDHGKPIPAMPFQYVSRFQQEQQLDPKLYEDQAERVSNAVAEILRDELGRAAFFALLQNNPKLFASIRASIWQAYQDGYREGSYQQLRKHADESMAGTGRILSALLNTAGEDLSAKDHALVVLGAAAGVPHEDTMKLVKGQE